MIGIVDYGLGNIRAFMNVYEQLSLPAVVASDASELRSASRIILPGVGGFDDAVRRLDRSGLRPALEEMVLEQGVPVLGVCVGMQVLACSSEEGSREGLGWVNGHVKRFSTVSRNGGRREVPHMGWNDIKIMRGAGLFSGLGDGSRFYFLHSYYFDATIDEVVLAVTCYGCDFICAIRSGNIFGVQFHPEKSHGWGIKLLENFATAEL